MRVRVPVSSALGNSQHVTLSFRIRGKKTWSRASTLWPTSSLKMIWLAFSYEETCCGGKCWSFFSVEESLGSLRFVSPRRRKENSILWHVLSGLIDSNSWDAEDVLWQCFLVHPLPLNCSAANLLGTRPAVHRRADIILSFCAVTRSSSIADFTVHA